MTASRVTVSVDDAHVAQIDEVVTLLRARGMAVEQVLPTLGLVTGTVDDVAALTGIPGVMRTDAEEGVQLPPPDAGIQEG